MKSYALGVAGTIFALIALLQLSRLYFKFSVVVESTPVPLWPNVIALIVFSALSFWMFFSLKSRD